MNDSSAAVENYLPMIRKIARRLSRYRESNADYDDFVSVGVVGILSAIERHGSVDDSAIAGLIAKRAIIDFMRKNDCMPYKIRIFKSKYTKAIDRIRSAPSINTDETEISDMMGIGHEKFINLKSRLDRYECYNSNMVYNVKCDNNAMSPFDHTLKSELLSIASISFESLTKNRQKLLSMYYTEGMTLKEISEKISICIPRASQLKSSALKQIRAEMENGIL